MLEESKGYNVSLNEEDGHIPNKYLFIIACLLVIYLFQQRARYQLQPKTKVHRGTQLDASRPT
ncbi:hypothetical protein GE21DRAFT_1027098 [Neurospora crassa]|nr:hypothetical protein GE21DRAFT_1027098 [Neurospora crassa]